MKTNQLMNVAFSEGEVEVFHKTKMGNLTQLWSVGNLIRMQGGGKAANLTNFLQSAATKRFIEIVEDKTNEKCFEVTGSGNKKRTWANMHLMIYAAEYLSPEFHFEVIDTFINGKLLELRDHGGDAFNSMTFLIDHKIPDRVGKDNKGVIIQVSKRIKHKVNPELQSWNDADKEDLKFRLDIERKVTTALELGLVQSYDHLKNIIDSIEG
jgi:hypothetical protein